MIIHFTHSKKNDFDEKLYMFHYEYDLRKPDVILIIVLPNNASVMDYEQLKIIIEQLKIIIEQQLPLGGNK
jgi:DNA-directed RNA polymerase